MTDIFDLTNISDIPSSMRKARRNDIMPPYLQKVLHLFDLKNPLTFQEISTGYYRSYNEEKNVASLSNILQRAVKRGLLEHKKMSNIWSKPNEMVAYPSE